MTSQLALLIFLLTFGINSSTRFPSFKYLSSKVSPEDQAVTAKGVLQRLIPNRANEFNIHVDPQLEEDEKDVFTLVTDPATGKLNISGNTGVVAVWGFYHYLKYHCGCHVAWGGSQLKIPKPLPVIPAPAHKMKSNDKFRYYQNVCTVSYSFAWFNWTQWETHIDWMALHGINFPLAFTGQEAIFQRVLIKLGFSQADIDGFFGGPAFLAWSRMGNIQGWGGPLPQTWINDQLALQHRILDRMRKLGMVPILAGFGGHMPASITKLYPNTTVTKSPNWSKFKQPYTGIYIIDFQDPMFNTIGKMLIEETISEFGTNHVYAAGTFNEMRPKSSDPSYLKKSGAAIYNSLIAADPKAIWLMQGWLFQDASFWKPPQAKALLTSVPQGRMIVLDLFAEVSPMWKRLDFFYGQPFIWCMLHNFGGTMDLYGDLESVNVGPANARSPANSSMIGTGLSPEGIFQNYVMYEFLLDESMSMDSSVRNISKWISGYVSRRYGTTNQLIDSGWQLLRSSIYNCTTGISDGGWNVVYVQRPKVMIRKEVLWYDPEVLYSAWDHFVGSSMSMNSSLFRYDLVDVTRNSLQILHYFLYKKMVENYITRDLNAFTGTSQSLLSLILDLDTLLLSDSHFLLGKWLEDAKSLGYTDREKKLYEYNARNQVTLWGPDGEIVDYASKQWSGLLKDYYYPRWKLFVDMLKADLTNTTSFSQAKYDQQVLETVEKPFTFDHSTYPTEPQGDSLKLVRNLYTKYRPITIQLLKKKSYY
ncbi:alpha-N-acetylglucosaminidase isoform X2 [Octopus sinensis]|uniref:Alpha-N-acetylglucosaminidase isoform X2 n=1 Tax=Octopus sinensis TaxID=2607531 RepID=A0A6P7SUG4_9MOLL|nr:alpha-N-acetylglucosaminidase isoform X2 [Octopus sinensis]